MKNVDADIQITELRDTEMQTQPRPIIHVNRPSHTVIVPPEPFNNSSQAVRKITFSKFSKSLFRKLKKNEMSVLVTKPLQSYVINFFVCFKTEASIRSSADSLNQVSSNCNLQPVYQLMIASTLPMFPI